LKKIVAILVISILVIGAFAAVSAPRVKAQETGKATIVSYSWYISQNQVTAAYAGDIVAVGEVQNTGNTTLGTISVYGIAYNSTGTALCTATADVYDQSLLSGQKAPFYMDFDPDFSSVSTEFLASNWASSVTNVTLFVGAQVPTNQTAYAGLTTSGLNHLDNTGTYTITGTITNTGSQAVGEVWAVTTFYNASGTVVAINYTDYLDPSGSNYLLSPGNGVTFTATPADNTAKMSSEITNYSILVESVPYAASSSTSTPSGGQSTPSPTPTATSPTKTNQPSTQNSLWTYVVVVVVAVVVAALIALTLFRNKRRNLKVEPPLPPPPPPPPQ
jgi:hypothetical protein